MRLGLAQVNTTVGDLEGNARLTADWIGRAAEAGCDLVLFPELTLPGYPAGDLYLQPHFARATRAALDQLAVRCDGIAALVGFAEPIAGADRGPHGRRDRASAHNSLALLREGRVAGIYRKRNLPNYSVFDELRQFTPGNEPLVTEIEAADGRPIAVGLTICEDCWIGGQAAREEVDGGAELILNASASPWHRGRGAEREAVFTDLARSLGRPIALCNLVGAQDGLVFDGQSFVVGASGAVLARAGRFEEQLLVCELGQAAFDRSPANHAPVPEAGAGDLTELRAGLVLGLRDYVEKNGFGGVVFGLSGGIDSALVAALAVEALGPGRVTVIVMPSPHSSTETQADARRIAATLGATALEMPIGPAVEALSAALAGGSPGSGGGEAEAGLAAENLQARVRGNLVMAVSNRDGLLALSCGNKSEAAVGYATLYGDMAGGLAPIKDLAKTVVYELAAEINRTGIPGVTGPGAETIPASVIERAPSAELRPDQRDTDSLPPYEVLDRALEGHLERDLDRREMVAEGIPAEVADRVIQLVAVSEHKRHQAAPGIRVTPKALDGDRRMPITNRYRAR